jgi:UTP--glucose-1-phosphate uridylyltransferase
VDTVPLEMTNQYGIIEVAKEDGHLVAAKGVVEKPAPADAPSTLAIIGRYILEPIVLTILEHQERGRANEIQLTDAMAKTIGLVPFNGYRFEGRRFDCGTKVGYLEANLAYALERGDMSARVREMLAQFA